jgi:7-carboxy-7-deazaguanine synthase
VCWFVRFGGCNLSCSWCDTPYTWDATRFDLRNEMHPATAVEIAEKLPHEAGHIVVLSGGETLLHQHNQAWKDLLGILGDRGLRVHVETNGTIPPSPESLAVVEQFVVSPKMPHAGSHKRSQNPTPWAGWPQVDTAVLKVVVETADDVAAVARQSRADGWRVGTVWVMPEGVTVAALQERWPHIAQAAADNGVNATHRLHVLAWLEARGH